LTCACGKGASLEECCGPIIRGEKQPETAEALMRARYTAYTSGEVDFILGSHDPTTADQADPKGTAQWAAQAKWLKLEVVHTERGGPDDKDGIVEFIAHYEMDGRLIAHHERSEFRKLDGRWFYVDGDMVKPAPVRVGPQPGRNDPCPCGSGKKYKKCCLDKAS
jgi:SEC-C motif-containing protein